MRKTVLLVIFLALLAFFAGCTPNEPAKQETPKETPAEISEPQSIKLATTTSCDNSGLLVHILPDLKEKHNITVDVIAVGTGKALEHGCAGDVDVVLVHAPKSEMEFIEEGCGSERFYVCQNEFFIIGPEDDPAGLKDAPSIDDAMNKLTKGKAQFISRGDNSGTHKREKSLWEAAGIEPSGDWYIEAGQGMGAVLTMASEQGAYALTDSGTYYSMSGKINLPIAFQGAALLDNIYSVILLNEERHPDLKHDTTKIFKDWLTSKETGEMISKFEKNGHVLFKVSPGPDYKNKP